MADPNTALNSETNLLTYALPVLTFAAAAICLIQGVAASRPINDADSSALC